MRFKWFAAIPLLCGALVANATEVSNSGKAAGDAKPSDLVCTYESAVGSHLKKKVCVTRAERDERARQDQQGMDDLQRRGQRASPDSKSR